MSSTPTPTNPATGPAIVKESPVEKLTKRKRGRPRTRAFWSEKPQKAKPSRVLPTDRITFERQLDILRAYAAASDNGAKPTTSEAVAEVVKMVTSTVSLANPFFTDIGLLQKVEAGFVPAPEVVNFLRAYSWNTETAAHKLAPLIQGAWFSEVLIPKLRFDTLQEEQAINSLGESANVGPDYKKQLRILIEYIVASGLAQRDGTLLKLAQIGAVLAESSPSSQKETEQAQPSSTPDIQAKNRILTAFSQTPEGAVNFNVQVRVEMTEFRDWSADRIAAFFSGIAEVLAAKAGIEKRATE